MLTLVQLQYFVAVAEELHFGEAAARLSMTQPPLSRQIQLLEAELGARLFRRTSRQVLLTPAGEALLPAARSILALVDRVSGDVRRVAAGTLGTLSVGHTTMASLTVVPEFLARARAELPGVTINLRQSVSIEQFQELELHRIDLGFLRAEVDLPGIVSRTVVKESFVAALPADSGLARLERDLEPRDLDDQRLLMYDPRSAKYMHDLVSRMLATARVRPVIDLYADQIPILLSLVAAGMGYAIVPQSAQRWSVAGVELRGLRFPARAIRGNEVHLEAAWREDDENPALRAVLELLPEATEAD